MNRHLRLALALLGLAVSTLGARAAEPGPLRLRYAVVVGVRSAARVPVAGSFLSPKELSGYLVSWNPEADNPEIRRIFALNGLSELLRQAATLPAGGGDAAGTFRLGDASWTVKLAVRPDERAGRGEAMVFRVEVARDGTVLSAPSVVAVLGERAVVSTRADDQTLLFVVVEADAGDGTGAAATASLSDRDFVPPQILASVPAAYPEEAKRARVEGPILVAARIEADGRVTAPRIVKGLGHGLDEAALASVRQWRYHPARRAGQAIAVDATLTVNFVLGPAATKPR